MEKNCIKFLKVRDVKSPSRANKYDAGIDFYIPEFTESFIEDLRSKHSNIWIDSNEVIINPGERILIPSGIHCQMSNPERALIAFNKSGIATKTGLVVGAAVVDFEYMGEIHISLINTSKQNIRLTPGMKIVQFLEIPVYASDVVIEEDMNLHDFYPVKTSRGDGGFGSTDNK